MDFDACPDVQVAVPEDAPQLMALMRLACAEDAQHSIDEGRVWDMVGPRLYRQGGLVGVVREGEIVCGYVLLVIDDVWYSQEKQLLELSLFVHPDYRRSNYAKQLMAFSKRAADGTRLDLTIGVLSTERTSAKVRLYQRQFATVGAFFRYRPRMQEA